MTEAATATLTGGQAVVRSLERHGIDTVFGIPGEQTIALYAALAQSRIRHVVARHEQAAGYMADGYARVSGRPGVCLVVTGPGLTNIATPLAQAYTDSVPLLVIAGQIRSEWLGRGGGHFHELRDQLGLGRSLVGWAERVARPADIPAALDRVFALFAAGRARGAVLEIPQDVFAMSDAISCAPTDEPRPHQPDVALVERAARLLGAARQPALVVGGGARRLGPALTALAERLDAPVLATWRGSGALPPWHPLMVGLGTELAAARAFLEAADAVLVLDSELGQADFWPAFPALGGRLVRVDLDPDALERAPRPDVAILGDVAAAVPLLLEAPGARPGPGGSGAERAAALRGALDAEAAPAAAPFRALIEALRAAIPPETLLALDLTGPTYWAVPRWFPVDQPDRLLLSGLGTLGYALPAAIGAKLAAPELPAVVLAGDGGFLFTGQELLNAAEHEQNLLVLVWNNRAFGDICRQMLRQGIPPLGVDLRAPDFPAFARALGCVGARLEDVRDLGRIAREAFGRRCPTLVEVVADD